MFDERMFEITYNKLKSNPGNMTPDVIPTKLDGINLDYIHETIKSLRNENFWFKPGH